MTTPIMTAETETIPEKPSLLKELRIRLLLIAGFLVIGWLALAGELALPSLVVGGASALLISAAIIAGFVLAAVVGFCFYATAILAIEWSRPWIIEFEDTP